MTRQDLKSLIIECLNESDVSMGGKVGQIPLDVLKQRMVPSQPSRAIKLSGFKKEVPDPELQKELDSLSDRFSQHLNISMFGYTDHINLKTLNASKEAPTGTGSSFMRDLTKLADDKGLMITLTPAIKGYGGAGFKKTSSYQRLVNFYKRFGFKDKYSKSSYRPDLSDTMFREPKVLNERNVKVGPYKYYGFTEKDEDYIQSLVHRYHTSATETEKNKIKDEFESLYQKVVGSNPVLNRINITITDYKSKNTPVMDLVYGAVSGIPPEDIRNYIEITKGAGGTGIPSNYKLKALTPYIQIEPKEQ
jgi:hypothetical protein